MNNDATVAGEVVNCIELAAMITMAFVSNNTLPDADLPSLLASVHGALLACDRLGSAGQPDAKVGVEKPSLAQIKKSIRPDGLVSFIDGKTYTLLKRHLTTHGLDPRTYRERYGLPDEYPMAASNCSAKRSAFAQANGLGQRIRRSGSAPETVE